MNDNIGQKLELFKKEIMAKVSAEENKAEQELEQFKAHELQKYTDVALEDAYGLIQSEVARQQADLNKAAAEKAEQFRKRLLERRDGYTEDVFTEAEEKLKQFSAADPETGKPAKAYLDFLLGCLKKMSEAVTGENETILFVRPEDLPFAEELKTAFGKPCKVEEDKKIVLGGVVARNDREGYYEDQSLSSRLQEQREWFCANSGMIVTM